MGLLLGGYVLLGFVTILFESVIFDFIINEGFADLTFATVVYCNLAVWATCYAIFRIWLVLRKRMQDEHFCRVRETPSDDPVMAFGKYLFSKKKD